MNWMVHYNNLIERRKKENPEGYTENHHIIPTCLGGPDIPENRIKLTAREHFIAHALLIKIHPGHYGLILAANWMNNNKQHGSRKFAWLKKLRACAQSELQKGKPLSDNHRNSMRESRIGKPFPHSGHSHSEETRNKMRESHLGKVLSRDHRSRVSEATKGKKKPPRSADHSAKLWASRKAKHVLEGNMDSREDVALMLVGSIPT